MAIQIPNPGTGNGATGDNEFVLWSKVKGNFTDQANAASRLVGTANGNLAEMMSTGGVAGTGWGGNQTQTTFTTAEELFTNLTSGGSKIFRNSAATSMNPAFSTGIYVKAVDSYYAMVVGQHDASITITSGRTTAGFGSAIIQKLYSDRNTTKDANGFLKAASPIVKVFADKVELNGEAVDQDVTYKKNGVGDYTITTVSGLSTDGWYIELPKDMNGNPKVAVTLTEVDGVISLKSYKRIFSMETFTFEPDLDSPLDIPDTRWIDLRLNEIPVEMPDDTQTEV